jgi:IS30 family transposase
VSSNRVRRSARAGRPLVGSAGRPRAYQRGVVRRFWRLVGQGWQTPAAADACGVSRAVADRWFRDGGGMPSVSMEEPSGRYLSFAEREDIAVMLAENLTLRAIAGRLGRSPSTISREVRRNAATRGGGFTYRASTAQWHAERRARRPKPSKLAVNQRLRAHVQDKLGGPGRWSPEQIARRLVVDFPHDGSMRVSHEAIYQALYVQGRGALRRELTVCLRTGRAVRKPRRRPSVRGNRAIPEQIMISERPAEVEDRAVPGHWEGDLIVGSNNSAIGTLVERKTRFVMLVHLPRLAELAQGERGWTGRGAEAVRDAIAGTIVTLPHELRRSLTWDQGPEMAQHAQLKIDADLDIYFCDPHSPWQRATNENTNGLLRQYFPKGSDLFAHGPDDLAETAAALNGRPRKTLGWQTPAEAFNQELLSLLN